VVRTTSISSITDKPASTKATTTPSGSINLNIKPTQGGPVKQASGIKQTKKIDMGAAANFGKQTDLGINSPTHRNTHAEDLFSPSTPSPKQSSKSKDLLDDIFQTCPAPTSVTTKKSIKTHQDLSGDEFDPRAGDGNAEFGDFSSAFGGPATKTTTTHKKNTDDDEFADFASAFTAPAPAASAQFNANNLLFSVPTPSSVPAKVPMGQDLLDANVFGTSLAATEPTMNADLLSDFGGLNLGNPIGGE
jgi:clathrin interactor 1